jgi:hypothetical protein
LDIEPFHFGRAAGAAVGPGWKERLFAGFAAGSADLALLQMVDEVVDPGGAGKTDGAEFSEAFVLLLLTHSCFSLSTMSDDGKRGFEISIWLKL